MPSVVGTTTELVSPDSSSVSLLNGVHTTTSDTTLLLCFVGIEGNENPDPANPCLFDIGGTDQAGSLIHDTGSTGSNGDVRCLVYGFSDPGEVASANVRFDVEFSANPIVAVWVNVSGTPTTNVTAATNYLAEDVNTVANSAITFGSAGSAGNLLFAWGVGQTPNMGPATWDTSFTNEADGSTDVGGQDLYYSLGSKAAPDTADISWGAINENTGIFMEAVAADTASIVPAIYSRMIQEF